MKKSIWECEVRSEQGNKMSWGKLESRQVLAYVYMAVAFQTEKVCTDFTE